MCYPRITSVSSSIGMRPWMRSRVTRLTADVEPFTLRRQDIVGQGADSPTPVHGWFPQLIPALTSDPCETVPATSQPS